jgi:hypothetical protein
MEEHVQGIDWIAGKGMVSLARIHRPTRRCNSLISFPLERPFHFRYSLRGDSLADVERSVSRIRCPRSLTVGREIPSHFRFPNNQSSRS